MLRTGYNQGPQLVWWWLDGYIDFNNAQTPQAKEAIRQWFDWHRTTQLPQYAARLSDLSHQINDSVTSDQVCGWYEDLRSIFAPALDHAMHVGAPLVPGLSEAQLRHLEQRYAKGNDEFREDYLQTVIADRRNASIKRSVKRFENFYGSLNDAQKRLIADGIAASPFDAEAWLAERQRRQSQTLLTLRQLIAESTAIEHVAASLRMLTEQIERSPDSGYRVYQEKLTEYNCAFMADVHNSTDDRQRRHASDKLKNWGTDLRMLGTGTR